MSSGQPSKQRIVVIGGGFAGIYLVKHLDRRLYDVILVDSNNYHSFPPLFYQIASAGLDPASIAFPFRREMRKLHPLPSYHIGEVRHIDTSEKTVTTQYETIHYDRLVIAAGTRNNFFGMPSLDKYVFTIKRTSEALRCRNEILDRFERAAICRDSAMRRKLLSFVVVGGGPTGVEIAGALGEMKRYILKREYPSISPDEMSITLVEGSDRLLQTMSRSASEYALKALTRLMVDVQTDRRMQSYTDNVITFADGGTIYSGMVIWTAGVTSVSFEVKGTPLQLGHGGRIIVDEFNRAAGLGDSVMAIGDIALHTSDTYPAGCPQLAQVAIQQARTLARNLNRGVWDKTFSYRDKGSMATIGRGRAVADLPHLHLKGWLAWMAWMFVHLISILGMRNKVAVLVNWTWAYFTYPTSLRLLIHPERYPLPHRWGES